MAKWCKLEECKLGMMDALMQLDNIVDESDPDVSPPPHFCPIVMNSPLSLQTSLPNSVHSFQTAERIREQHPELDWFHLTGLIHDVGKIIAVWGEPQYAVVGDTFPVGCRLSEKCVFSELFEQNPDKDDERYKYVVQCM